MGRGIKKIRKELFYIFELLYYKFIYRKPNVRGNYKVDRFIIGGTEDFSQLSTSYKKFFPLNFPERIKQGNLICEHIFDLLGSRPKKLSPEGRGYQPIDWHSDFRSGYRWDPKKFYRKIRYGHIEGVDVKVPWELSYFHHLTLLGQAYLLTLNDIYAKEFENEITDWIDNNRVGFGVGWTCSMIVAIRVVNWLVALEHFSEKTTIGKEFLDKFYSSVYEHGKFIWGHLEYSPKLTTNHYISNIAALFFIAVYCPFFKESKKWLDFSIKELTKEIDKQTYDDGCDFEASTSYHRLALEMFFYCSLLADRARISLPKKFKHTLRKMFYVSLHCIKPNGMIPQIGDNDSGCFLVFAKRPVLEHKYLLTLAAMYYKDLSFKLTHFNFDEEAFWVFGETGKKSYDELPSRTEPLASKSFPDAGWFIIRHHNDYCFIACGPKGQNENGGHAHNDKLSFELVLNGRDIIVDPGTYTYTAHPKERKKFRSTEYHNAITFDGYEQNEISANAIFSLPDRVKIANAVLTETDDNITFQGEIRYLNRTHKRVISLDKKSCNWQITDRISCGKAVDAKLAVHLSPDVFFDNGFIFSKRTKKRIASIEIPGHSIEKSEYDYSPEYGVKLRAECLVANISSTNGVKTINTYIHRR